MDKKPLLNKNISLQDFRDFYWYKEELIAFCRSEKLDMRGGKIELANRIIKYLETGEKELSLSISTKTISRFNWHTEKLTMHTLITDNYQNTENVRAFFRKEIGDSFKFNVAFMKWMKTAQEKTLGNAIEKWLEIKAENKTNKSPKEIAPQFEYNTYIRDFMSDNPSMDRNIAIECWKIRKTMRGDHIYRKADLELLRT